MLEDPTKTYAALFGTRTEEGELHLFARLACSLDGEFISLLLPLLIPMLILEPACSDFQQTEDQLTYRNPPDCQCQTGTAEEEPSLTGRTTTQLSPV